MHRTRTLTATASAVCALVLGTGCTPQLPASAPTPTATPTQPAGPTASPSTPTPTTAAAGTATPDFDGDGAVDLATSFFGPREDARITVRYGSGSTTEITAQETILDEWGNVGLGSMLAPDLNGDGFSDLVFVGKGLESGTSVCELFGSVQGLSLSTLHCIPVSQVDDDSRVSSLGLLREPVPRLAVGVSSRFREDTGGTGRVLVFPLGADGRSTTTPTILAPGTGAVPDLADQGSFGESMAVAGHRLFVGAPRALIGSAAGGAIAVLGFNAEGATSGEVISQASPGVPGEPAKGDAFGASLAARDGHLAVGVPGDRVGAVDNTGAVQLFTLSEDGQAPGELLSQATEGVPGRAETGDGFGSAVALGTVCPGIPGVVVGAPDEAVVVAHEGDGSAWVIPLERSAACPARQLWEGHGLGGQPQYWRRLGEVVAVISDPSELADRIVLAGSGLVSDLSPIGVLAVWAADGERSLYYQEESVFAVAGR